MARAGARLWAERRSIDAAVPTPFDAWALAATRLLAEARTRGELADGIDPSDTAVTLVCAFFGFCTLTDEMRGGRDWGRGWTTGGCWCSGPSRPSRTRRVCSHGRAHGPGFRPGRKSASPAGNGEAGGPP